MLDVQNGMLYDTVHNEYVDVEKAVAKANEIRLTERAREEAAFNEWYKGLMQCPEKEVLSKIPFDYENMSLRTLIPELYSDSPRRAVVEQQAKEANEKLEVINNIINELNKKGLEELLEFNRRYSGN